MLQITGQAGGGGRAKKQNMPRVKFLLLHLPAIPKSEFS